MESLLLEDGYLGLGSLWKKMMQIIDISQKKLFFEMPSFWQNTKPEKHVVSQIFFNSKGKMCNLSILRKK